MTTPSRIQMEIENMKDRMGKYDEHQKEQISAVDTLKTQSVQQTTILQSLKERFEELTDSMKESNKTITAMCETVIRIQERISSEEAAKKRWISIASIAIPSILVILGWVGWYLISHH